jgi:phosphoglycerate dehydrogenase-like enzyme
MKPGALLINAGRGGLVDQKALADRLRARRLRAALDVTDPEPLPPDHPLWTCPGLIITPHVAAATHGELERLWKVAAEQIQVFLAGGVPANLVRS